MKLGGSCITDKSRYKTARHDDVERLARELASVEDELIVVHGAGSFGHVLAREHKLAQGADGSEAQRLAAARVHADVRELGLLVTRALDAAGRPALWHSTYDLARLHAGGVQTFATAPLVDTLRAGFTPVLSGDVVLDATRGFGILSGDVIMVEVARELLPLRAVFATDVDGIFDKRPADPDARVLATIGPHDAPFAAGAAGADVTGGMAGKLARARDVAAAGVPVHVVNGRAPGVLQRSLAGDETIGTVITA